MCFQNSRNTHGAGPTSTGTPHFNETQQEPPIAPPAPSAPLMSQSQPATAPVYHTHEAEIDLSGNNGQSTFDSLKQGV
jgi:hypothetical protein